MRFKTYRDNSGYYRWRLVAANGKIIADSGEGYVNYTDCLHGIELVKATNGNTPTE